MLPQYLLLHNPEFGSTDFYSTNILERFLVTFKNPPNLWARRRRRRDQNNRLRDCVVEVVVEGPRGESRAAAERGRVQI